MLALGGAVAFIVALVVFVQVESRGANAPARVSSPSAIAAENREANALVGHDQAPHVVTLAAHVPASSAIRGAVVAYMKRQIANGSIEGTLMKAGCTPAKGSSPTRLAFRCQVMVGNVYYPFLGVVDTTARQITYCKRDYPPVPSMNIPVSKRCT